MRGNLRWLRPRKTIPGPIPAHAGKPFYFRAVFKWIRAYPRACGETIPSNGGGCLCRGLSPRMRGNHLRESTGDAHIRPIPAHAGKPSATSSSRDMGRAYPRACGETDKNLRRLWQKKGLSPRMRGNQIAEQTAPMPVGPIPAHAGKPGNKKTRQSAARAYPRACGETSLTREGVKSAEGLSPRMRGNHLPKRTDSYPLGPIPAHAGKPFHQMAMGVYARAYPRACGETRLYAVKPLFNQGLSPRMRGNRTEHKCCAHRRGPIPAHAGKPDDDQPVTPYLRAYPRACGETGESSYDHWSCLGLSPRMRGNHLRESAGNAHVRPIPAHAGKPTVRAD